MSKQNQLLIRCDDELISKVNEVHKMLIDINESGTTTTRSEVLRKMLDAGHKALMSESQK